MNSNENDNIEPEVEQEIEIQEEVVETPDDTDGEKETDISIKDTLEKSWEKLEEPEGDKKEKKKKEEKLEIESSKEETKIDPPVSWEKEAKEEFKALPPKVQQYVLKREQERDRAFQKKTEEIAHLRKSFQGLNQILTPEIENWRNLGLSPEEAIARLVRAQRVLDSNPVEGIKKIAKSYGIDLDKLPEYAKNNNTNPELQAVTSKVQQIEHMIQSQKTQQVQAEQAALLKELELFEKETDSEGNVVRPYFEELQADMTPIVVALREAHPTASVAAILHEAYNRALWANPKTREAVLKDQATKEQAKRIEETKRKAVLAKKAGSSITGAPSGVNRAKPSGSLRDSLERAWENLT